MQNCKITEPHSRTLWVAFLLIALAGPKVHAQDRPSFSLEGFATIKAWGINTTTGGGNAPVTVVKTSQEFLVAAERSDIADKKKRDNTPRVIRIENDLDLGVLANERGGNELKSVGIVYARPHTTIFAAGAGATLRHGTIEIHGAVNVIIRNLRFRDLWEYDPTGKYDRFGWDFIRITNSGKEHSHHVWVDHCDFAKAYDGALDITHGSDLVTVSWCRFGGDESGPHKKVMLIGHSSSTGAGEIDQGRLNVTLHHNFFQNIADRAPRVRFGNVHAYNNFIDGAENATISVMKAVTLVENCFYKDARIATTFSHAADTVKKDHAGTLVVVNSRNESPRLAAPAASAKEDPNRAFEIDHNFKSSVERFTLAFNAPAEWTWEARNQLPYGYRLDPADAVPALLAKFAGTGKLPETELPKQR